MLWNDFVSDISRRVVPGNPDWLLDVAGTLQAGIAAGALTDIFNAALADQTTATRQLSFGNNGAVTLQKTPEFTINLMFFRGHLEHLYYEPVHSATVVVNECEVEATRYCIRNPDNEAEISNDSTLVEVSRGPLRKGDAWLTNGRDEILDLNAVDSKHPLLATLIGSKLGGLCWTFDRKTLKAWYATSVDYEVTAMVTIADLLGRLRDRSALDSLVRLYDESSHHYARWSAVKNIGRIDKGAGVEALKKAMRDRHPELRRAAERTLVRHGLL